MYRVVLMNVVSSNENGSLAPVITLDLVAMDKAAESAAELLKSLSNPARLRILCALVPQVRSVGELELALGRSQSYVSGQLARLRAEGLVEAERDGRVMRYRLADPRLTPILLALYTVFCVPVMQLSNTES
jgi:ArsR family transcriptional regulator, virulence genes transcriptional regulator